MVDTTRPMEMVEDTAFVIIMVDHLRNTTEVTQVTLYESLVYYNLYVRLRIDLWGAHFLRWLDNKLW